MTKEKMKNLSVKKTVGNIVFCHEVKEKLCYLNWDCDLAETLQDLQLNSGKIFMYPNAFAP